MSDLSYRTDSEGAWGDNSYLAEYSSYYFGSEARKIASKNHPTEATIDLLEAKAKKFQVVVSDAFYASDSKGAGLGNTLFSDKEDYIAAIGIVSALIGVTLILLTDHQTTGGIMLPVGLALIALAGYMARESTDSAV